MGLGDNNVFNLQNIEINEPITEDTAYYEEFDDGKISRSVVESLEENTKNLSNTGVKLYVFVEYLDEKLKPTKNQTKALHTKIFVREVDFTEENKIDHENNFEIVKNTVLLGNYKQPPLEFIDQVNVDMFEYPIEENVEKLILKHLPTSNLPNQTLNVVYLNPNKGKYDINTSTLKTISSRYVTELYLKLNNKSLNINNLELKFNVFSVDLTKFVLTEESLITSKKVFITNCSFEGPLTGHITFNTLNIDVMGVFLRDLASISAFCDKTKNIREYKDTKAVFSYININQNDKDYPPENKNSYILQINGFNETMISNIDVIFACNKVLKVVNSANLAILGYNDNYSEEKLVYNVKNMIFIKDCSEIFMDRISYSLKNPSDGHFIYLSYTDKITACNLALNDVFVNNIGLIDLNIAFVDLFCKNVICDNKNPNFIRSFNKSSSFLFESVQLNLIGKLEILCYKIKLNTFIVESDELEIKCKELSMEHSYLKLKNSVDFKIDYDGYIHLSDSQIKTKKLSFDKESKEETLKDIQLNGLVDIQSLHKISICNCERLKIDKETKLKTKELEIRAKTVNSSTFNIENSKISSILLENISDFRLSTISLNGITIMKELSLVIKNSKITESVIEYNGCARSIRLESEDSNIDFMIINKQNKVKSIINLVFKTKTTGKVLKDFDDKMSFITLDSGNSVKNTVNLKKLQSEEETPEDFDDELFYYN